MRPGPRREKNLRKWYLGSLGFKMAYDGLCDRDYQSQSQGQIDEIPTDVE